MRLTVSLTARFNADSVQKVRDRPLRAKCVSVASYMSNENKPQESAGGAENPRRAQKGVKDNDEVVTGALGEPIPGAIADATDGELK